MYYLFLCTYKSNVELLRKEHRPNHLARLEMLKEEGRLLVAGPYLAEDVPEPTPNGGFVGSVIIAEFASLAAAKAWADEEPFKIAGVYQSIVVKPFIKTLP